MEEHIRLLPASGLKRNLGSRYREGCHEPHNHGRKRGRTGQVCSE
jgi:hypothetical protein